MEEFPAHAFLLGRLNGLCGCTWVRGSVHILRAWYSSQCSQLPWPSMHCAYSSRNAALESHGSLAQDYLRGMQLIHACNLYSPQAVTGAW